MLSLQLIDTQEADASHTKSSEDQNMDNTKQNNVNDPKLTFQTLSLAKNPKDDGTLGESITEIIKCSCGGHELATSKNVIKCNKPDCQLYLCPINGCSFNDASSLAVEAHQAEHVNDPDRNKNHLDYCDCGVRKIFNVGMEYAACPNPICSLSWCRYCEKTYKSASAVQRHIKVYHQCAAAKDKDTCGQCGKAKKTRIPGSIYSQCPVCSAYWCLIDGCHMVFSTIGQLSSHKTNHNYKTRTRFCFKDYSSTATI